jgi:limonene-1,2-epoxide hydrolase
MLSVTSSFSARVVSIFIAALQTDTFQPDYTCVGPVSLYWKRREEEEMFL